MLLEIFQRIEEDVGRFGTGKDRYPVQHRAGDEVGIGRFVYFVSASAHGVLYLFFLAPHSPQVGVDCAPSLVPIL